MKIPVCFSLEKKESERINTDPLIKHIGRSAIVRIALSEYFDKREKENKNEESREKKVG